MQLGELPEGYPLWKLIYQEDQQKHYDQYFDDFFIYYINSSYGELLVNSDVAGSFDLINCLAFYSRSFPIDGWTCWGFDGWEPSAQVSMTRSSGK